MFFSAISTVLGASAARMPSIFAGSSRSVVHLANIGPAKGSTKTNTRRGRGQGSGKGGTAGRGHKGQLARSGNGKPTPGFAGGQTPIMRLFPKRGFLNFTRRTYAPLPLKRLQQWIADERLDPSMPITVGAIVRSNAVHGLGKQAGIKLLGPVDPDLPLPPLNLELSRFSKSAADAVIAAGGKVTAVYHNNLSLRQEIFPEKFIGREVRMAQPTRRTDLEYYTNPANHGYLANTPLAEKVAAATKLVKGK